MVRALAAKELREALRSVRFAVVVLVSLTLIPASVFINTRDYEHRVRYHEEQVRFSRIHTETAGLSADLTAQGFRTPSVLGILFSGIEAGLPSRVETSRDGLFTVSSDNPQADGLLWFDGATDLGFLTTIVLSLLAFVFVHGTITREKEEGTLRVLVSTGASRATILCGKLLGSYTAFAVPVALGLLPAIGIMLSSPPVREHLDGQVPVLLVLILSVFLLLLVLFLLATLVSMFAHRSGVAVVLLVVLWVLLVPAIPRTAPMIARIAYPAKPYDIIEMEKRLVKSSAEVRFRAVADSVYAGIMRRYGVEVDSLVVFIPGMLTGSAGTAYEEYERAAERLEASYQEGVQAQWIAMDSARLAADRSQERLASLVMRLSPVGTFSMVATTLAGTGPAEWGRGLDFARRFQAQVADELYSKWIVRRYGANRSLSMPTNGDCPPVVDRSKLHAVFGPAPAPERLRAAAADILILAGMAFIFGTACWLKFRSYDVR